MMEGTARNYANLPNEILSEFIFSYLNARDLRSAAMVCRSWSQAANHEKSIRGGPCCFSIRLRICKGRTSLDKIENMRIKPSAGFFFIPYNTLRNIEDHIEDLLPDYCEVIMLYGKSVILETDEMERFKCPIVCAFLPQIPNVRIKSFTLAKLARDCVIQESAEYREIIKAIVDHETSISNHETSTCFMLFSKGHKNQEPAKRWASAMQESKEVKIASVWGGTLKDIYIQRTYKTKKRIFLRKDAPECVAVLITGAIQTWSTVLDRKCNTLEQIEARLNLFKDEVKLKKHSIGFMLQVCETSDTAMYRESNVESTIFRRLFPKVPLACCLNEIWCGIFGKTTTVNEANEENNDEEEHESWYNKYNSTVFLILTYG